VAYIDLRYWTSSQSMLNILKTLCIAIIISLGTIVFNNDINSLALWNINRMLNKVNQIATNPLSCKDEKMMKMMQLREKGEEQNYD